MRTFNLSESYRKALSLICVIAFGLVATTETALAQSESEASIESIREKAVKEGIRYLKETGADEDGSYSKHVGPAVTALVTTAILKNDVDAKDETVAKSLAYLKTFIQPDGGIYAPESVYKNYETSLAVMCFAEANKDGSYDEILKKASRFLKSSQWGSETRETDESDPRYGGFGYGKHGRPDLSNTSYTIDALLSAGEGADSEAIQRALKFVSRTQNHESPHNTLPHAAKVNDGGFYYTPAGEGETKAEPMENGGLRSYGSMTYAGLKSMLYAGVDKDDSRVIAATGWIRKHYGLEDNPGMGAEGLFYYYHVFAKTLNAIGEDEFEDDIGVKHNWRTELVEELAKRQASDGSWVNSGSDRWMEGDPNLVTGYALLALSYCKEKKEEK